jgi:hypothetical protein
MEPPGRCGDWLAPPPSPPRAHAPGRHDERGVGTFIWPPAGTYTWPSAGTLPWPWTAPAHRTRGRPTASTSTARGRAGTSLPSGAAPRAWRATPPRGHPPPRPHAARPPGAARSRARRGGCPRARSTATTPSAVSARAATSTSHTGHTTAAMARPVREPPTPWLSAGKRRNPISAAAPPAVTTRCAGGDGVRPAGPLRAAWPARRSADRPAGAARSGRRRPRTRRRPSRRARALRR